MYDSEVTPELIKNILTYCENNMIADGWMGRFGITPSMRDEFVSTSSDFKNAMELIPYISRDTINVLTMKISSQLARDEICREDMDKIKMSTALLSKQMEFIYKMEKDSGLFKDEADSRRKRASRKHEKIGLEDLDDLKELLERQRLNGAV